MNLKLKKLKNKFFFCFLIIFFFSCSNNNYIIQPEQNYKNERILESFPSKKPQWIYLEPEKSGNFYVFIGVSDKFVSEKDARQNALKNCVNKFAAFCGVQVSSLYESLEFSHNLSNNINNALETQINKVNHSINAFISRVKADEWYIEKWGMFSETNLTKTYYIAYLKALVPIDEYKKVNDYRIKQKKLKELEKLKKEALLHKKIFININQNIITSFIEDYLSSNKYIISKSKSDNDYIINGTVSSKYLGKDPYGMFEQSEVSINLKMTDIKNNKIIISKFITAKNIGNNQNIALNNAMKKLGKKTAQFLLDKLNFLRNNQ